MKRIKSGPGRRLALNKETLRTLGDADLQDAAGGNPVALTILPSTVSISVSLVTITLTLTQTDPPEPDPEPEPAPEPKTEGP